MQILSAHPIANCTVEKVRSVVTLRVEDAEWHERNLTLVFILFSEEDHPEKGTRKPSYVGLSCTVSGYSNFTKYQSPSRKTRSASPSSKIDLVN
jgi:hypothetical protein